MRTIEYGTTTHVPAFLTKLWKLVTDVSCDDLISWSLAGTSFIIYDEIRFSKELLPMYFKHNNMASFVRQLNMYGFRKLSCIDQGGMHCYKNEIEFYHQYFLKGQEKLLELIKRKIPTSKSEDPKVKQEYLDELISNIRTLQGRQESAEQNVKTLRRENKILWRHVSLLTDRYTKQQTVIQQLLPFFMNMMRSSREIAMKRKAALMIAEGDTHNKLARLSPPYYVHSDDQDSNSGMPSPPGNVTNRGPVITELECSKLYPGSLLCSPDRKECETIVNSPMCEGSLEGSGQTMDAAFNEPSSMETLKMLNQNYERRSRSKSINGPILRSSYRASKPAKSATISSLSNYPSTSSTVIIDETTSDLPPMSSGLVGGAGGASVFASKMESDRFISSMMAEPIIDEETVAFLEEGSMMRVKSPLMDDRSMMNDNSMMNENSMMAENSAMMRTRQSLINENTSSMMGTNSDGSSILNARSPHMSGGLSSRLSPPLMGDNATINRERSASMSESMLRSINGHSPPMMSRNSPPMPNGNSSPMMNGSSPSIMNANSPPMMNGNSPAMMNGNSSHMMNGSTSPMVNGNSPPMMNGNSPPMMNGNSPSMMNGNSPPMMNGNSPPMMSGGSPIILNGKSPPLINRNSPPMINVNDTSMMNGNSPSMMNGNSPSMMNGNSPSMMNGNSPSMMNGNSPPLMSRNSPPMASASSPLMNGNSQSLMNGNSSSILNDSTVMMNESASATNGNGFLQSAKNSVTEERIQGVANMEGRPSSMMTESSDPRMNGNSSSMMGASSLMMNEGASTSSGNVFPRNLKREAAEVNWMMNQSSVSESSFETWLGQILKSENISNGCSMPQPQQVAPEACQPMMSGSVNFV